MLVSQRDNLPIKQAPIQNSSNNNSVISNVDTLTLSPTLNALQQFLSMNDSNNNNGQEELSLSNLEQLKQQGDMLASMLQMKLKNFESNLISSMKNAGVDQITPIDIKNNSNGGLNVVNDTPNKEIIQNLLQNDNKFKTLFQEISRLSALVDTVDQLGSNNTVQNNILSEAGAKYAQFSNQMSPQTQNNSNRKNESDFILHVLESGSSSMF
jgi:hypothetical protein